MGDWPWFKALVSGIFEEGVELGVNWLKWLNLMIT
jgi:hypothetical protein